MTDRRLERLAGLLAFGVVSACSVIDGGGDQAIPIQPRSSDGVITVSFDEPLAEISPLIRGVSGSIEDFEGAGVTLNSWGGIRATRYNYQLGNAWNLGRAGGFRNESVQSSTDLVGDWLSANQDAGVASRVGVPALGWIARDGDASTCSFPDETEGGCLAATGFDCTSTGPIADPGRANVGSSPRTVAEWIGGYFEDSIDIDFLAIDNEPERWGIDHYDVHPTCSDYFEIFGTYVAYAEALRAIAPAADLTGPVMCCWYDFADPPGPDDTSDEDLLSWFLRKLGDRSSGAERSLVDVVDVHFRPQADVLNARQDGAIDALRVQATRELWDPDHRASGSISEPIEFLPRLRRIIDEHEPGLPLMVSDWRFGGESTMSGALSIATALGVFAREGVYAAAHADTIDPGSPAYLAFKLFGDYDDRGGEYRGIALETTVDEDLRDVEAFAALDGDTLRLVVIDSSPDLDGRRIELDLGGLEIAGTPRMYSVSEDSPDAIAKTTIGRDGETAAVIETAQKSASIIHIQLREAPEPTVTGALR